MNRLYSSRDIEKACRQNINYMYLLEGKPAPDHATIARFHSLHFSRCSKKIMAETTWLLRRLGELGSETVFIDGTKIEANANKYTFVWKKAVTKSLAKMMEKVTSLVAECEASYGLHIVYHDRIRLKTLKRLRRSLYKVKAEEGIESEKISRRRAKNAILIERKTENQTGIFIRRRSMKKIVWAVLLCLALAAAGCAGGGASPSASSGPDGDKKQPAAEATTEATDDSADERAEKSGEPAAVEKAAAGSTAAQQAGSTALTADQETAAADASNPETADTDESNGEASSADASDQETAADASAKDAAAEDPDQDEAPADDEKKDPAKANTSAEKQREEAAKENDKEKEDEEDENEYVPDYFSPYGVYTLVYDSGYQVKTRYSAAGLTFYMESEEFQFILDKNLPNFPKKVAHILFNTQAPMDPAEAEAAGESFPFDEHYMIYMSLDDGSYYEVSRNQLDLRGRIFVRDLYESFREKWEGAF